MLRWQSILISTISMLAGPNLDSPANLDAAVRARPAWRRALAPDPSCPDPACAHLSEPRPVTLPRAEGDAGDAGHLQEEGAASRLLPAPPCPDYPCS